MNFVSYSTLVLLVVALCICGFSQHAAAQAQQTPPPAPEGASAPAAESTPSASILGAIESFAAIDEYKVCYDPNRNRNAIACGARDCPTGTRYVRTVRDAAPECNGTCVDMKALGWRRGHKTRFCTSRGYDGVIPASKHDYKKGGCCFKNPQN